MIHPMNDKDRHEQVYHRMKCRKERGYVWIEPVGSFLAGASTPLIIQLFLFKE